MFITTKSKCTWRFVLVVLLLQPHVLFSEQTNVMKMALKAEGDGSSIDYREHEPGIDIDKGNVSRLKFCSLPP